MAEIDESEWDGNRALGQCETAAEYRKICAGEKTVGEPDERQHWALPHHYLGQHPAPNAAGVRNALARFAQTEGLSNREAARAHLESHMNAISGESETAERRAPLEYRDAAVTGVNFDQRIVEMIAMPYEEEATVEYRGELWKESFDRGAFDGIEKRPNRVRANRDHDKTRTVGKAVNFWPSRQEGLVAEVRIAPTPLGDETLALANEDMLSVSAGFGVRGSDQVLDRPYRRIKRAFLDHLAFVESPAYDGARVISVRRGDEPVTAADLPKLVTPNLDEILAWMKSRQASR